MSVNPQKTVPAHVSQTIGRYRLRKASQRSSVWVASALAAGLFLFVCALAADRFVDMPLWLRVAITTVTISVPALLLLIGGLLFFRRGSMDEAAGEIDDAVPGSRDLLRTSLNLSGRPGSDDASFMLEQTFAQAESIATAADRTKLLRWRAVGLVCLSLILAIALAAVLFSAPNMKSALLVKRFLNPRGNFPRPSMIEINVDVDDSQAVQQGDDVTIRANLAGIVPPDTRANLVFVQQSTAANPEQPLTVAMNPRPGGQFEATLKNIAAPLRFVVAAADGVSEQHVVQVKPRPAVTAISAKYTYPRYTLFPPKQEPVRREFKGVEGTVVRVDFECSIPVNQSKVIFSDRQIPIHWDRSGTKGNFQFTIAKDTTFTIQLTAESGTDNRNEAPYRIRLTPDSPPTAALLGLPENATFTRDSVLNLSYKGSDDFGVSEIFLRYRRSSGSNQTKDYSLQNSSGTTREVAGDFALPLQDITREDDIWVEVELVMVDGKGQEGTAPAVRLQVTSNTPERQLVELLDYLETFSQSIFAAATSIDSAKDQLAILLETMSDSDALTGSRQTTFDKIKRGLNGGSIPVVIDDPRFRFLTVSEYPYLLQRRAHDLFARAVSLPQPGTFSDLTSAIEKDSTPRRSLQQLKSRVDVIAPNAVALRACIRDTANEARLTLIDLLASQYLAESAETAKGADAAALQGEKQEIRVRSMLTYFEQLKAMKDQDALLEAMAGVRKASAAAPESRKKELVAAVGTLRTKLNATNLLRGELGVNTEAYLRANTWPMIFQQAVQTNTVAQANLAASVWGRLGRCNPMLNTADAFVAAAVQQAGSAGDTKRLDQTIAAGLQLSQWTLSNDLYERVELLRRSLTQMDIDIRTGRLLPNSTAVDDVWMQVRELHRSLVSDFAAGRFAGLSPTIDKNLQAFTATQASFSPWLWREVSASAGWAPARADVVRASGQIADELLPRVREGRGRALSLLPSMLTSLASNIASEKAAIAGEMPLLKADVDLGYSQPVTVNNSVVNGKTMGRRADLPRVNFAKALSDRFTSYAIAMGAVCDMRQSAWSDQPTADAMDELRILSILFESLSTLDEDVYDKTYALHLQQKLRTRSYPAYLEETGRYMTELAGPISRNESILKALAAGEAHKLAADGTVTGLPALIGKQVRFEAQMNSLTQQLDFAGALKNASNDAARRALLLAAFKDIKNPTAYWDRIYLACLALLKTTTPETPSGSAGWSGVAPAVLESYAASIAKIRAMLPETDGGDEAKTIAGALDDFPSVMARVRSDKMASATAARADALDAYEEWRGQIRAALQVTENRMTINVVKSRPRPRIATNRADLEVIFGRLIQNEARWVERIATAARITASSRTQQLVPPDSDPGTTMDDLAFDFSREGLIRRRSIAVAAQSSRGINIEGSDVDEQFLKMPKHLYMELVRNAKKPYPSQYKAFALDYVQGLLKDAR